MTQFEHMNEPRHTYKRHTTRTNVSCSPHEWVTQHTRRYPLTRQSLNETRDTYERVKSHTWRIHIAHKNVSMCDAAHRMRVLQRVSTYDNEACKSHARVLQHNAHGDASPSLWRVCHTNESPRTQEWATSRVWTRNTGMSHFTCMNESNHTSTQVV